MKFKSLFRFILNKIFEKTVFQTFIAETIKKSYNWNVKFNRDLILLDEHSFTFEISKNKL